MLKYISLLIVTTMLKRRKKGISTVLGSLLVLLIVVSIGTALFVQSVSSVSSLSDSNTIFFDRRSKAVKEDVVVENIVFLSSVPKSAKVYVRNAGSIEFNVTSIYVNKVSSGAAQDLSFTINQIVNIGNVNELVLNSFDWEAGATYKVTIATLRGSIAIEFAKA